MNYSRVNTSGAGYIPNRPSNGNYNRTQDSRYTLDLDDKKYV